MFIGGTLLYISYCVIKANQRGLCAKNQHEAQKVLFINGLMRFQQSYFIVNWSWVGWVCTETQTLLARLL